jgi:hypothetical protein
MTSARPACFVSDQIDGKCMTCGVYCHALHVPKLQGIHCPACCPVCSPKPKAGSIQTIRERLYSAVEAPNS